MFSYLPKWSRYSPIRVLHKHTHVNLPPSWNFDTNCPRMKKKLNLNNPLINFHKFLSWQLYDPHVLTLTLCDLGSVRRSHRSVSFPFGPTYSRSGIQHRWSNQGPESISNTTYGGFAEIRCNRWNLFLKWYRINSICDLKVVFFSFAKAALSERYFYWEK